MLTAVVRVCPEKCSCLRALLLEVSSSDYFENPDSEEAQDLFREILSTLEVSSTINPQITPLVWCHLTLVFSRCFRSAPDSVTCCRWEVSRPELAPGPNVTEVSSATFQKHYYCVVSIINAHKWHRELFCDLLRRNSEWHFWTQQQTNIRFYLSFCLCFNERDAFGFVHLEGYSSWNSVPSPALRTQTVAQ